MNATANSPSNHQPMQREKRTVEAMVQIYCRELHGGDGALCPDCQALLDYAVARIDRCPYGADKPVCAQCTIHCYRRPMREQIRQVMRYAGPRMLARHPLLTVQHWLKGHKQR